MAEATLCPPDSSIKDRLVSVFPGFSCPFEPFLDPLADFIAGEYARGISRIFVEKHRETIIRSAPGLWETVAPWIEGAEVQGVGWDLCFGDIYRAVHANVSDPWVLAVGLGMHLGAHGLPGEWRVELSGPLRLRWGSILLPAATAISVGTDGQRASVTTQGADGSAELRLFREKDDDWRGDAERIPRVTRCGVRMNVLNRSALVLRDFDDLVSKALPVIDPRMVDVLDQAVQVIDTYTPMYVPWVRRAIHNIFILYPRRDTIESGSVEHYLGLIHLSAHAVALPIAELLVHEAAHQHMNLLTKLGPIDDGTDPHTYYSPPVDKHRKLSLIMAAYHAFANVLLFYRVCRSHGIAEQRECSRQEAILVPWLEKLEEPLSGNPALTDIGRALWLPLKSQVKNTA